jgi:predicted nuclease with TOPRIM domain
MGKNKTGGMRKLSKKTKEKVDEMLNEKEIAMLKRTQVDIEKLRPKISDKESFNKLIEAVETATRKNESVAQLQKRIKDLGEGVFNVSKQVLKILT